MIGPILLALTWLLLRLERQSLRAIGVDAPTRRLGEFGAGFLAAGLAVLVQQVGQSMASGVDWSINPALDAPLIGRSLRFTINSVLSEEFVFRGYLLVQALRWFGVRRGLWLSAAAFGIYHWFSYGAFGNPVLMAFLFVFTGAFGLMLATAFAHTRSLAAPIGLHFGWNLISYLVFSAGPLGPGILIPANGEAKMNATGVADFALDVGVPMLLVAIVTLSLWRRARMYRPLPGVTRHDGTGAEPVR